MERLIGRLIGMLLGGLFRRFRNRRQAAKQTPPRQLTEQSVSPPPTCQASPAALVVGCPNCEAHLEVTTSAVMACPHCHQPFRTPPPAMTDAAE